MQNFLRPANKLPPDIISQIARCSLGWDDVDPTPIVPLTRVCRYWRKCITSAPENWTLISSLRPGLAALSLKRSEAALLRLRLCAPSSGYGPKFLNLIVPHIQRIRTLEVWEITTVEDFTKALPNFPQSMPNLQSLEMARLDNVPEWDPSIHPFGSFSDTLTSLNLYDIPLYPSFLKLKTLTELTLHYYKIRPPLDTILNIVEDNCSLKSVTLTIDYENFSASVSKRRAAITNRLQRLHVTCWDGSTARTLISNIPLRRGADLGITFCDKGVGLVLDHILSDIPITHLPNLRSPTYMEYSGSSPREIRLFGPNGSFWYYHGYSPEIPFAEFSVLPLADIREVRFVHCKMPTMFHPLSFPALETLTLEYTTDASRLFSALLPDPSSSPSLKTLGFLDCVFNEEFMGELARFASNRKNTTSAWLHRVVIVQQDEKFPSVASIRALEGLVSVVDIWFGTNLPTDLT